MKLINHIIDLRRRKVFRAIGLYLVGAWVLLQIGDVIAEPAGLPDWSMTLLLYILIGFFPLAIFLGWRYELTEHGLVKTRSLKESDVESVKVALNYKDYLIITAIVAVSIIGLYQFTPEVIEQEVLEPTRSQIIAEANSIAVLPYSDNSPTGDQGYLADGVADAVLHMLSKVKQLKVTSKTSSFSFKNKSLNASEIASYLNVAHILEGSIQRVDDKVRVTSRLVDTRTGTLVWSGNSLRDASEIFAVQDEIALEVITALKTSVLDLDDSYKISDYQPSLEAYEARLKGLEYVSTGLTDDYIQAEQLFREAIELDENYALAYSDLAWSLIRNGSQNGQSAKDMSDTILPIIEKILSIEPLLSEGHHLKAYIDYYAGDRSIANRSLERALELNPNNAAALIQMAYWQDWNGDPEKGLELAKRAVAIDPNNHESQLSLAIAYWSVSQAERAMSILKKSLRLKPELISNYTMMARWLQQVNRTGDALRYVLRARELDPNDRALFYYECFMYDQLWDWEKASNCELAFLEQYPDDLETRKFNVLRDNKVDEAIELQNQLIEKFPNSVYRKVQMGFILFHNGRYQEAYDFMRVHFPEFESDQLELTSFTHWPARIYAHSLILLEQEQKGLLLLEQVEEKLSEMRLLQGSGWTAGIEMAEVYAIRGERNRALQELNTIINSGWRFYSSGLPKNHHFKEYWDTEEFKEAVMFLEEDMAMQRAWFEENKDKRLF